MEKYIHTVHYYETDKMGIAHHANYIHWMEEARIAFLHNIGWDYARLESLGIISPVTAVDVRYRNSVTFSDDVIIEVSVSEFKGVRLKIRYDMKNTDGKTVAEAGSEHCFLNTQGRPIRLSSQFPELNRILTDLAAENSEKNK